MALGYRNAREVYNEALEKITSSPQNWISFLNSATWNFGYTFGEQVLIYAQRPNAIACLSMEKWNTKLYRWVKKDSKAITILKYENGEQELENIFDIRDTYQRYGKEQWLWRFHKERYSEEYIETLESKYGELENANDLASAVISAVNNMFEDNKELYLSELKYILENQSLNIGTVEVDYLETIKNSIIYSVLKRIEIEPTDYISENDFMNIDKFNNPELTTSLGTAYRELTRNIMIETKRFVRNMNRSFDLNRNEMYVDNENDNSGGRILNVRIQTSQRLPSTEHSNREQVSKASEWQVRNNEREILERTSEWSVREQENARNINTTFESDTSSLRKASRDYISKIGGKSEVDGENESRESNGVGTENEQFEKYSRGDSDERDSTESINQRRLLTREEQESSLDYLQEKYVLGIFQNADNLKVSRSEIRQFYREHESLSDRIEFIKQVFGNAYTEIFIDNERVGYKTYENVLHFWKGAYLNRTAEVYYRWERVAEFVAGMIMTNEFYSKEQLEQKQDDQLALFEQEKSNSNLNSIFTQELIDCELKHGSHFENGKFRIYKQFISNSSTENNIVFLKHEYGIGGVSSIHDGTQVGSDHDAKGIIFYRGYDDNRPELRLSWNQVAKRIKELIDGNKYLSSEELEEYRVWNNEEIRERIETEIDEKINASTDSGTVSDSPEIISEQQQINLIDNLYETRSKTVQITPNESDEVQSFFEPNIENNGTEVEQLNQFIINNDDLGIGTLKEKFRNNINAIEVLKKIEFDKRLATKEEQEILSKYVGWGGLSKAFDENAEEWKSEYTELKNLLTEKEYEMASSTVLTAFYTPPIVISAMYEALSNMGFSKGRILEPSCGTGNFIGRLPEKMKDSSIYGVELDSLTGRIAKQLYQKSNIFIQGFETTEFPDNSFDIVIGNVPFGNYSITDTHYDENFLIHDYFFAKSIDKVKTGGIIAFITSKGTLDKENTEFRKYISQKADLVGAIRLPNNTFTKNADTNVTTDIIFLQKRAEQNREEPNWIYLGENENGIKMNQYFIDNPHMILGNMELKSTQYGGYDSVCRPYENSNLKELLKNAISYLDVQMPEIDDVIDNDIDMPIVADENVRNFSFTIKDNKLYYRENFNMYLQDVPTYTLKRIKKLIDVRECVRNLIDLQMNNASDETIISEQKKLNFMYDNFIVEFGRICDRANRKAFEEDSSYPLLCSLEINDDKGNFIEKAPMFSKRTINPNKEIESVSTSKDALVVSMSKKLKVDLDYMNQLSGISKEELVEELKGAIYKIPYTNEYVTADEYLSGSIREKLKIAKEAFEYDKSLEINVKSLEDTIPKDLSPSEISVRLGASWIPQDVIEQFMHETFETRWRYTDKIKVSYIENTANWYISNKSLDGENVKINNNFGTHRINAYKILEATLNLKNVRVFDKKQTAEGEKRILNKEETTAAQEKQEIIRQAFDDWIWKDFDRRERLVRIYNDKFNSIVPREYNGDYLDLSYINPEITLMKHQRDAVAHGLYGGNVLFAHEPGAGKTYELVVLAMESIRLKLKNKVIIDVPNNIVEQFADAVMTLYPAAKLLVTTKKDFSINNRKRFCSKIATGDYELVIIAHSQFSKIQLSPELQRELLTEQLHDIMRGIQQAKDSGAVRYTIKQLELTKKKVEERLKKLNNSKRKDNVVYFDELGVDMLLVDEVHNYKNLYLYSKMKNVSGISQVDAQKSSDLYMKCTYINRLTNYRGVAFATGTPVSNSMAEIYTMQRYLQYNVLEEHGLQNFDAWASIFGEAVTRLELAPEGTGYRVKTSFSKFNNLPELMNMFKMVADIKTTDMLDLPLPKANYENIYLQPTNYQVEMLKGFVERAEKIRGGIDPSIDNMLKVTNDGRKLALDQRLLNDIMPDDPNNKTSACANKIYDFYQKYDDKKLTQLVFCDLSTPKSLTSSSEQFLLAENNENSLKFIDVYTDLKCKLIKLGIPKEEIAFVHEADNEDKLNELHSSVRSGKIRVLIGSTSKMGEGMNVQDLIKAIHILTFGWKPSQEKQIVARGVRQGNLNDDVYIFRYIVEKTFDAFMFQTLEKKQKMVSQVMTSKTPMRSIEDIDEMAISYGEIMALASGNPLIKEKMELDIDVSRLKIIKQAYLNQKYDLEAKIKKYYPVEIETREEIIQKIKEDRDVYNQSKKEYADEFPGITIDGVDYKEKESAGNALLDIIKKPSSLHNKIANYRGFDLILSANPMNNKFNLIIQNTYHYKIELGSDLYGNLTRIENVFISFDKTIYRLDNEIENLKKQLDNAIFEANADFKYETELNSKLERLAVINTELNLNEKEKDVIDYEEEVTEVENSEPVFEFER